MMDTLQSSTAQANVSPSRSDTLNKWQESTQVTGVQGWSRDALFSPLDR